MGFGGKSPNISLVRAKTFATSISTTLIVAALASVWAVTSPLSASCASAFSGDQIVASPAESAAFVNEVNKVRASKGLSALAVSSNLASVAQDWAVHMAQQEGLSHRPNLAAGVTVDWKLLGENVGRAPEVDQQMTAFINSATHYKNLVEGSFTHIGVGTVRTPDGLLYTAHEFANVRPAAPAPSTAPAPSAAPTSAPAPAPKVVSQPAAPVVTVAPAPAPSTSTTEAPVTVVEHSVSTDLDSVVESASTDAAQSAPKKSRTGC